MTIAQQVEQFVDEVLRGADPVPHILIGPVVWRLPENSDTRQWYLIVGSGCGADFWVVRIDCPDKALAERCRASLYPELIRRRPCVVHDCDDELAMACLAEAIWPSPETAGIRRRVEAEMRAVRA